MTPTGASAALAEAERLNAQKADEQAAAFALSRGADKLRQGDVRAAIVELKDAVRLAPHLARAHYQLALALRRQGAQADARAHFAEARRLAPWIEIPGVARRAGAGRTRWPRSACSGCARRWALARPRRTPPPLGFAFTNIAREAGLSAVTVFGGERSNRYLLETTGCGVALFDYDNDGRLDIFIVNGTTLEGFPKGQAPISHLYRNKGDGTFEDVTAKAGVGVSGWGQGAAAADYDNDGDSDLFVTFYGQNRLFRNDGDGTFTDVTARAGLATPRTRWGTGAAFLDYDRDGRLDLFVANYIDLDLAKAPTPDSGLCRYKGIPVACGPPGLPGGANALYRNKGDGTFEDVSERAGILKAAGHLRSRRQHVRLRRRWLDRRLRRERFEPERALSQQSRRHVHGRRRPRRLRLQPGRQAAGRHGRGHRRLRSQRHLRHRQDELRRRHDDAVRQPRSRLLRGPDVRQPASASTRDGSAGAPGSSTSTTTAGSTSSSSTATSIPR